MSKLQNTQDWIDVKYINSLFDVLKIGNALVYHIISKTLPDMATYVHMKQRKSMQEVKQHLLMFMSNILDLTM